MLEVPNLPGATALESYVDQLESVLAAYICYLPGWDHTYPSEMLRLAAQAYFLPQGIAATAWAGLEAHRSPECAAQIAIVLLAEMHKRAPPSWWDRLTKNHKFRRAQPFIIWSRMDEPLAQPCSEQDLEIFSKCFWRVYLGSLGR